MTVNPQISEWGNPPEQSGTMLCMGRTRGTETSHYPEEKKTIVIPLVVAIERGTA